MVLGIVSVTVGVVIAFCVGIAKDVIELVKTRGIDCGADCGTDCICDKIIGVDSIGEMADDDEDDDDDAGDGTA